MPVSDTWRLYLRIVYNQPESCETGYVKRTGSREYRRARLPKFVHGSISLGPSSHLTINTNDLPN